ncbi:hypothetical protein [Aureimonas sp. SA4125]|uniref:hypothetical protein n=1 Tax=Aureimonas sp. SA4125 TaxID=2826993 RepID=UPI001CC78586|nr:hypothetical protein [Aureimonas sp. SA4125]
MDVIRKAIMRSPAIAMRKAPVPVAFVEDGPQRAEYEVARMLGAVSMLSKLKSMFAMPPMRFQASERTITIRISKAWLAERSPTDPFAALLLRRFSAGANADWGGRDYPEEIPPAQKAAAIVSVLAS